MWAALVASIAVDSVHLSALAAVVSVGRRKLRDYPVVRKYYHGYLLRIGDD
jgi:hypothetical protein